MGESWHSFGVTAVLLWSLQIYKPGLETTPDLQAQTGRVILLLVHVVCCLS